MSFPPLVYPLRQHAAKVFEKLLQNHPSRYPIAGKGLPVIYLQGHRTSCRDDTDRELPFHQEANFMYLTGASDLRGASVVVSLDKPASSADDPLSVSPEEVETVLFIPPLDPLEVMWCGLPPSIQQIKQKLPELTDVKYTTELDAHLRPFLAHQRPLITLPSTPTALAEATPEPALLDALHEARTTKTAAEIELLRRANQISSNAHHAVIRAVNSPAVASETDAESIFLSECRRQGAKYQAYEPIFGYGVHAGTLHYTLNDARIPKDVPGLLLVDAGCELSGYASDITRTIPVGNGGKFSAEARAIYSVVLEMQRVAIEKIKPGIEWEEIQIAMHKVAAKGLLELGILCNATVEECYEHAHVMPFFPHGVGHFLGLDTHDVGGLPRGKGKHSTVRYLRLQRKLEVGNVVTVEPGLYFNQFLLDPIKGSEFVNQKVLLEYLKVGGIRIEDNVVVTENGCRNLTSAVKSIEDIEQLASSSTSTTATTNTVFPS